MHQASENVDKHKQNEKKSILTQGHWFCINLSWLLNFGYVKRVWLIYQVKIGANLWHVSTLESWVKRGCRPSWAFFTAVLMWHDYDCMISTQRLKLKKTMRYMFLFSKQKLLFFCQCLSQNLANSTILFGSLLAALINEKILDRIVCFIMCTSLDLGAQD